MEQLSRPWSRLQLTRSEFGRLAAGRGDTAALHRLRCAQRNRTVLVLKNLADRNASLAASAFLLGHAHDAAPTAVDVLLGHPWLAVWAVDRVRRDTVGRPDYLPFAALAAAALAGWSDAPVPVPPRAGLVPVPGLGVLRRSGGGQTVTPADLTGRRWTPIRRWWFTHQSLTLDLGVDDVDPYRDCFGLPVAARLTPQRAAGLKRSVGRAWRLLVARAPGHAAELAAGMSLFVPLAGGSTSRHSVTHADGFGAFAADPDLTPVDLAVTMVHEFQHSKLNAVLGLVRLCEPTDPGRYFAPWRPDPRPIDGLLHGTYAFTAVAEVWAALRAHPGLAAQATARFAVVRAQLDWALRELARAPSLTSAGRLWTDLLAERVGRLAAVSLPVAADAAARREVAEAERACRRTIAAG
ncbi:HEXXH motif-containing putative peptide modification protein [Micromonospora phytophila]|uniref:aKG-HExxH-type peptide beta-hydroxylase n=1 Tax=Micromonospora phytophila TaxID=709888 RepID=UPI00202E33B0|nr:HEXXH motif-containing putative peptide modification protein [Micromonospora phytophila]MCM0674937.1 HEXXH motif-containing putative peptide modification protein [Micromonospora phytophila]